MLEGRCKKDSRNSVAWKRMVEIRIGRIQRYDYLRTIGKGFPSTTQVLPKLIQAV